MSAVDWYLRPWGVAGNAFIKIEIDPSEMQGHRSVFGPALLLRFKCTPDVHPYADEIRLHSLEGWIGWHSEQGMMPSIRIPSQLLDPNTHFLQVPISDEQVEKIEQLRNGEAVILRITLVGLATVRNPALQIAHVVQNSDGSTKLEARPQLELHKLLASGDGAQTIRIEREQWLSILREVGFGTRRLIELPQPSLPSGDDMRWEECIRLLTDATQLFRMGRYEQVLGNCRKIVEGVVEVLCNRWGIARDPKKPITVWAKDLPTQLTTVWPHDPEDATLFVALLNATFKWTSGSHHYGAGIPIREEVSFALSLTTDLLTFGAQVLSAISTTP